MNTRFYLSFIVAILLLASPIQAEIKTQTIAYEHESTALAGYLAYDDAVQGKRPAILVVHEWWGLNDYARKRAEQLADMGYVAFAVDMYGEGKTTNHPSQAGQWAKEVTQNIELWQKRALAGLAVLKEQPQTDPDRIAAIGYCFGGGTVQQLAYSGATLKAVVSFHGSLQEPPGNASKQTTAKFLICHGGADPLVKPEVLQSYLAAMATSGLDYEVIIYGNAKHGFTNPDAGRNNVPALGYNAKADQRSWQHMKLLFAEVLGDRSGAPSGPKNIKIK